MEFTNTFTIPVGIDEAFEVLTDLERVAPCMPGASLDSVDGDVYTGRVKVKVGPMSLTYRGTAEVLDKDQAAHSARISAKGNEARGGGTASADVTAALVEVDDGTEVTVTTNIDVTGKPAQFGRGVMEDVGKKIIDKFAECLAGTFDDTPAEADDTEATTSQDTAAGAAAADAPTADAAAGAAPGARSFTPRESETEALDLMEVAGAATAKRALPVVGAIVAVVLAILWWRRRDS